MQADGSRRTRIRLELKADVLSIYQAVRPVKHLSTFSPILSCIYMDLTSNTDRHVSASISPKLGNQKPHNTPIFKQYLPWNDPTTHSHLRHHYHHHPPAPVTVST